MPREGHANERARVFVMVMIYIEDVLNDPNKKWSLKTVLWVISEPPEHL